MQGNTLGRLLIGSALLVNSFAQPEPDLVRITIIPTAAPGGPERAEPIEGTVKTNCQDCRLVVFAFGDAWYVQPWANAPYTEYDHDGTWRTMTHLGTEYAALLVRNDFQPPARTESLPRTGGRVLAVARVLGQRDDPGHQGTKALPSSRSNTLTFSGYEWTVKTSSGRVGPGPNVFSSKNAWVDPTGRLHLRIAREGDQWTCAEVVSTKRGLGYGWYRFVLADTWALPVNAVLGLFTWDEANIRFNREMDIELSRWGNPANENVQFVIQPYTQPQNIVRFELPKGSSSLHEFNWQPKKVTFRSSVARTTDIIREHTFLQGIPTPSQEQVRLNLWLVAGLPPTSGQEVEVIIESFGFQPEEE